jgi:indolepyruvate decarboxylase
MDNGTYGVEQQGLNPNPFRNKADYIDYVKENKDKPENKVKAELLNKIYPYNNLPRWNYSKAPELFGAGTGLEVKTV